MTTLAFETSHPDLLFTSLNKMGSVPLWAAQLDATREKFSEAVKSSTDNDVIVVRERTVKAYVDSRETIRNLIHQHENATLAHFVLSVESHYSDKMQTMTELLAVFPYELANHFEVALGKENLEMSVYEAMAKQKIRNRNPLDESLRLSEATRNLRASSGRLSAKKIANLLGISVAELSKQLGLSRQAVSKTPDAKPLQSKLRVYERIARLQAVLSAEQFKTWLNHSFSELDGLSPMEVIIEGNVEVIANFAEDALMGNPS